MAYISRERKHKTRETDVEVDLDGGPPRDSRRRVRIFTFFLTFSHVIQEGVPFRFFFLGLLCVRRTRPPTHLQLF